MPSVKSSTMSPDHAPFTLKQLREVGDTHPNVREIVNRAAAIISELSSQSKKMHARQDRLVQEHQSLLQAHANLRTEVLHMDELEEDNAALEDDLERAEGKFREAKKRISALYLRIAKMRETAQDAPLRENGVLTDCAPAIPSGYASAPTTPNMTSGRVQPYRPHGVKVEEGELITLFRPCIPMSCIVGRTNSAYVDVQIRHIPQNVQRIKRGAYACVTNGVPDIECDFMIHQSFHPNNAEVPPTLTYVGFEFPDKTMLCYLPIKGMTILYRSRMGRPYRIERDGWSRTVSYGRNYVRIRMNAALYDAIVSRAVTAYQKSHGRCVVDVPEAEYHRGMVTFDAGMKPKCSVRNESGIVERTVLAQLKKTGGDVTADARMYLRFSEKAEDGAVPTLCFRLYGVDNADQA